MNECRFCKAPTEGMHPILDRVREEMERVYKRHGKPPHEALVGYANYDALRDEMRPVLDYAFPNWGGAITENYVAQYFCLERVTFVDWTDGIVLVNPGKEPPR